MFSGNLSSFLKGVKPIALYDADRGMVMEPMQGKLASSQFDLGHTNLFCVPEVTSEFFSSGDSVVGDSLEFNQANRGSLCVLLGKRNCSACKAGESGLISWRGEVSWVFPSCGRHLVYILELRQGWPFETRVYSAMSVLLSSYDGHLEKLNYVWQENTDGSGGEPGGQASLINWHSYIGIPINFPEE